MELTTDDQLYRKGIELFMMSKIQNLNGTHNYGRKATKEIQVVYDVKDTKFEWNSQRVVEIFSFIIGCL